MRFCSVYIPTIMHDITSVSGLGINDVWMGRPADPQFTDQLLGSDGPSQEELLRLARQRSGDFNVGFSQEFKQSEEEILSSINRHQPDEGIVQEYQVKLFETDLKVSHEDSKRILTALQGNHSRWDQLKKDIDQLAADPSSIPSAPPMELAVSNVPAPSAPPMELAVPNVPTPSAPPMELAVSNVPTPSAPPMELVVPSEDHQKERLEDYRARRQQEEKDRLLRVKECQANEDKKIQDMQQASIESIQEQIKKNATLGQLVLAARRRHENKDRPTLSKVKEAILTTFKKKPSTKYPGNTLLKTLHQERVARQADIVAKQQQAKESSSMEQIVTEYPGNELLKELHHDRVARHQRSEKLLKAKQMIEEKGMTQGAFDYYSRQNDVRQANIDGISLEEYLAKKSS